MSILVAELYDALRAAGVSDEQARAAAAAVAPGHADLVTRNELANLATKADLELKAATQADLAALKADLIQWQVGPWSMAWWRKKCSGCIRLW